MVQARELRVAAVGAGIVTAYMAAVLSTGRVPLFQFAKLLAFYLRVSFSLWFFLAILTILYVLFRNRPRNGAGPNPVAVIASAARGRWERDRFVSLFWPPLLFATLVASFNAFKQMVLPLAGFGMDPAFAQADQLLFLGHEPWKVTHAIFGSPNATWMIDRAYHGWFVPMSLGVLLCSWLPGSTFEQRNQYLLSYIAIWIGIGTVLAFLLPSAGPCYYEHFIGPSPHFQGLNQALAAAQAAAGAPLTALSNQEGLLRMFGGNELAVGAGISAMPSVHNGLAVLFAIGAWKMNRYAGTVFAAYAVLIWIGSIHLGWHYALDGIAAALLTFGIWRVCGWITERLGRALPAPERTTALA
jgi:hypothetical protein